MKNVITQSIRIHHQGGQAEGSHSMATTRSAFPVPTYALKHKNLWNSP
jgi:hypothetical protein